MLHPVLLFFSDMFFLVSLPQSESRMFNGVEKECPSPTERLARKESLKVRCPLSSCVTMSTTFNLFSLHSALFHFILSTFEPIAMNDGNWLREQKTWVWLCGTLMPPSDITCTMDFYWFSYGTQGWPFKLVFFHASGPEAKLQTGEETGSQRTV